MPVRFALAVILAMCATALTFASAGARPRASVPIMPIHEVRAGMKGYGLSVFSGTRVESFPITVLGVVKNYVAESALILIRVDGGYPRQHGVGIIAGMSGSPVYIGGRLVGAVSYGWAFSKEPIGGVTPIESMLTDLPQPPVAPHAAAMPSFTRAAASLPVPLETAHGRITRVAVMRTREAAESASKEPGTMVLTPVQSLLQVSGFSDRSFEALSRLLRPLDLQPVRAFAAAPAVRSPVPAMRPGAAVGVELMTGDLEIAGTGTLTYLDGRRFLAFGHAMAQLGDVDLPLAASYVHGILPSYQHSFKFASQIAPVGELTTDRLWAVGGTLGGGAPTVAVRLRVTEPTRQRDKTYRLRAVQHRTLTPALLSQASFVGVNSALPSGADATARLHLTIKPKGRPPIVIDQMVSGAPIDAIVAGQVAEYLTPLTGNDLQPLKLESVNVEARLLSGRRTASIERLYTTQGGLRRGEPLEVHVVLRPYGGAPLEKIVRVPMPIDLEKGTVTIGVGGGSDAAAMRKRLGLNRPEPTSIDQLVGQLETGDRGQQLVVRAVLPSKAVVLSGERFPFLPEALRDLLPGLPRSDVSTDKDVLETRIDTDWVIRGAETLTAEMGAAADSEKKKTVSVLPGGADSAVAAVATGSAPSERSLAVMSAAAAPPSSSAGTPPPIRPVDAPRSSAAETVASSEKVLQGATRRLDLLDSTSSTRGSFEGVVASGTGELSLAPDVPWKVSVGDSLPLTAIRGTRGETLVGTAPRGGVLRITDSRTLPRDGWHVDDTAVTSLALRSDGEIWIGSAPHGRVYRGLPDGTVTRVTQTGAAYVWALLPQPDGSVLAATGLPARLVRITPDGRTMVVATFAEQHARAVVTAHDGATLVATAGPGMVYRLSGDLHRPLITSSASSVDALLERSTGEIAAVSGRHLYRLSPDGRLRDVPVGDKPLLSLLESGGRLLTGNTQGRVYEIDDANRVTRLADLETGGVTALCGGADGVSAAVAGPNTVLRMSAKRSREGTWTSDVIDAGLPSLWGGVRWAQDGPGTISVQTRSGPTPVPDESWSAWSNAGAVSGAPSDPRLAARYLQVRVRLAGDDAGGPRLCGLSIFHGPSAGLATLELVRPMGGERLSGRQRLAWKATGATAESVVFDVAVAEGRGQWKPLGRSLGPTLKDAALSAPAAIDTPVSGELLWDTRGVADGVYRLRVEARDALSADRSLQSSVESRPFVVSNTPPTLDAWTTEKLVDGRLRVRGRARSRLCAVISVVFRQGGDDWRIAAPQDGLYDAQSEAFTFVVERAGEVEVRITDEAGCSRTLRRSVSAP